jgi:CRP-like cAMP-binding protein
VSDLPSAHPLVQFVRSLEHHVALSPEARTAILAMPVRLRMLESSAYLTREGDRPDLCGILASGYAYRQKETGDGQRQIVSLHIPGEALDLQHLYLSEADHSVQMLTRGEVGFVARSDLQVLASQYPEIARAITVAILLEASIFREWVLNVGRRNARSRMGHLLCEFAIRLHARGLVTEEPYMLPISQEQLADALGLTPVHVNRTLKGLEASGLIRRNKREIVFPGWNTLREVADFNQRYLHLRAADVAPGEPVVPKAGRGPA